MPCSCYSPIPSLSWIASFASVVNELCREVPPMTDGTFAYVDAFFCPTSFSHFLAWSSRMNESPMNENSKHSHHTMPCKLSRGALFKRRSRTSIVLGNLIVLRKSSILAPIFETIESRHWRGARTDIFPFRIYGSKTSMCSRTKIMFLNLLSHG